MAQIELCLLAEAAEQELNTALQQIAQKYNLPCWVMEPMAAKLHRALLDGKAQEIAVAKQRLAQVKKADAEAQESTEQEAADG